jgi:hypothetical protein
MKKLIVAAAAVSALFAGAAQAADGSLGNTSSGTFDVTATVAPMVQVTGLSDITLSIDPASLRSNWGTTNGRTTFCVFSNVTAAGSYNVQVLGETGDGRANPYGLIGQTTNTKLLHTVGYWDNAAYNSIDALFMRQSIVRSSVNTRNGQQRATTTNCSENGLGGKNASINVGIRNPIALAALADTYKGTLTVVVSVP